MQQSLVQVLVLALQQAPQSAHFSAEKALGESAATEAAAMRVRIVFMMLLSVFLGLPALKVPACVAGICVPGFASDGNRTGDEARQPGRRLVRLFHVPRE